MSLVIQIKTCNIFFSILHQNIIFFTGDTKFESDTNLRTSRDSKTGELLVELCGHKYPIDWVSSEKQGVVSIEDCEKLGIK